jgi:hypothetical protein
MVRLSKKYNLYARIIQKLKKHKITQGAIYELLKNEDYESNYSALRYFA